LSRRSGRSALRSREHGARTARTSASRDSCKVVSFWGGEGISAHGTTGVVPRDVEEPGAQKLRRRATSSPTIDHVPGPPARRPDRLFTLRWNSGEEGRLGGRREGRRGPSLRPHSRVGSKRGQPAVLPLFRVKAVGTCTSAANRRPKVGVSSRGHGLRRNRDAPTRRVGCDD